MADHPKFKEQKREDEPRKNIIISGGAQGIGRCLARTFLQQGHKVFIVDINEPELEYCVKDHLKPYSDLVSYGICNLRSVDEIRATVEKAAKFFGGRIDVLINNGGIAKPQWKDNKNMEDKSTMDEWVAMMETNLTAPFAMSQACIPYMKVKTKDDPRLVTSMAGPCIIHVGSFRAHQSDPNQEGYASTKAGQLGLMHSMAISCSPWGIRVNLIAPGRIKASHESKEGDENGDTWESSMEDRDVEQHPVNRAGRPMDVFQAADYLINAGFVTGQDITVDGGALRKKS
ncbi:short chain dehydrogenase [Tothia fuscella]|uniref:Short chain dehydrogenase n=1 Tax=Tothia fuscella TaxID=1048955 RepID=A0A9P4P2J8_9PEZI|nr:short chain dehydrogenase [Tothia fuscella]